MNAAHSPEQKLVSMANQIADYFRSFPEAESASGIADHIGKFWAPKMRGQLVSYANGGGNGLDALALKAVAIVKAQDEAKATSRV